jgi:hypothetical protein
MIQNHRQTTKACQQPTLRLPLKRRGVEPTAYIGGGKFIDIFSIGLPQGISARFGQKWWRVSVGS